MSKIRRSRRKAYKVFPAKYNADLIHGHRSVDKRFPLGVKAGGAYLQFPASLKSRRISPHSAVVPVPETQTHGKRGLNIARAGVVPRVDAQLRKQSLIEQQQTTVAVQLWQGMKQQGFTVFNRIVVYRKDTEVLELYFSGQQWIFVEENYEEKIQRRSSVFKTREGAYAALEDNRIPWEEKISIESPWDEEIILKHSP